MVSGGCSEPVLLFVVLCGNAAKEGGYMPVGKIVIGQKIGRWTVLKRAPDHIDNSGNPHIYYRCVCECGTEKNVGASGLYSGRSLSCGCMHKEKAKQKALEMFTTHGGSKDRLYGIWNDMKRRCSNPHRKNYPNYGGRGIRVCDEWLDYPTFKTWALNNGYTDSLSIDRIDNDGNYEPSNCRWASPRDQANNRRTNTYVRFNDVTHSLAEWARIYDIDSKQLYRLYSYYQFPFDMCIDRLCKHRTKK